MGTDEQGENHEILVNRQRGRLRDSLKNLGIFLVRGKALSKSMLGSPASARPAGWAALDNGCSTVVVSSAGC